MSRLERWSEVLKAGNLAKNTKKKIFLKKKKHTQNICTDAARSGQIWGPISQIWLVFQMWRSCFQIWPDLARSGNLGNFFFQKKKKTPQIWPDLEIWPVFFSPQISGYCLPGKGTLEFFFSPLNRANFDDLRPFKAKFGTFEHLWGSKTWFCEPEISWFLPKTSRFLKNLEKKKFFFPGKF